MAYLPLHAQPVITQASIAYGEVVSEYSFTKRSELTLPLGSDGVYDFTACGDEYFPYQLGEEYFNDPVRDVPPTVLPALRMFEIDEAFRASFGDPLPDRVIRLNRLLPTDQGVFEENDILKVKPSGLYYVAYQTILSNGGEANGGTYLAESENIYVPFGLHYGEQFDTVGYRFQPNRFDRLDSVSTHTVIDYFGYGTFLTWMGEAEEVAALLYTENETLFRLDGQGGYYDDDYSITNYLYLLSARNAIPRAVLRGTYDPDGATFYPETTTLYLPTGDEPSATALTDIPGATIGVFPNPIGGSFHVDLTLDRSSSLDVDVYTATGQMISRRTKLAVIPGLNRIPILEDGLPAGFYIVRLTLADGSSGTQRVVVE
ncbi:T9SS type A sorting domain-containing protein [Neolewinella sp.]|uniref:T9SS type A sorting domain-containing protein n=1 Tax=Neolewinella sp. TaxID=2993543 RepID=UPI003B51D541